MAHLTSSTLDVPGLLDAIQHPALGGTAIFVGTVRGGSAEDGPVVAIEYSAYEAMAEAEAGRIAGEVLARWPGARVVFQHRLGRVGLGEASVAVVVACPHREEAFAACRYVIEEIKRRLPVWKKELYQDGSAGWRANDGSREPAASTPGTRD